MSKQTPESTMTEKDEFKSSHNLDFLSAYWNNPFNTEGWQVFKVGTCHGQWVATETTYDILSVINDEPGNGHFNDVLEWFEQSCRRDKKALRILEVMNDDFAKHLVYKRGFTYQSNENLIKRF